MQAADVAGFRRVEQRDADAAGVEDAEEADDVVQVLRAEDRDAVARLGDLLQAGADGAVARGELRPADVAGDAVALDRVVEESVGEFVAADLRPFLDVTDQVGVVGERDPVRSRRTGCGTPFHFLSFTRCLG